MLKGPVVVDHDTRRPADAAIVPVGGSPLTAIDGPGGGFKLPA
jgi:hypothetical protein